MFETLLTSAVIWPLLFVVGLIFGSFISLISYRIAHDLPWVAVRSRCPSCQTALGLIDLVPLLSFVAQGGRCRHCGVRMSLRYFLIEALTGFSFVGLYSVVGTGWLFFIYAGLVICIITLIVTDLEHYIIPDVVQIAMFGLGCGYVWLSAYPVTTHLIGFAIMLSAGLLLHYGYYWLFKRHGLGFGDVKLFAVFGLWLTPAMIAPFFFFSGFFGIITAFFWRVFGLGKHFPFGPAMALALLLCVLQPEMITQLFTWLLPL